MNSEENHERRGKNGGSAQDGAAAQFSFRARRYLTSGQRRLFTPHKTFLSPTFTPETERARPILRSLSGSM
jgi:hypothetical protein